LVPSLLKNINLTHSLAGVQPKVVFERTELCRRGEPYKQKDLIVNPFDAEFTLLTVNELFCMETARFCGIGAA